MSIKSCCGAYCQLDGTISCCEHSDLRTKCWFYWKYQDGARRKQITRHEYYCPSCSNRLDDVRIAQQHTKTLQASSTGLKKIQHTHCTHDNNPKFEMSARHLHFYPRWLETKSMSVLLKAERMHKKLRKIRHGYKKARKPAFQYQAKLDEEAVVVVKVPKSCGCYCDFNRSREDCCCIHLLQKLQNSKKASKKNCDDHHVGMCHSDFCQQCRLRSVLLNDPHVEEPVPKFYPSAIRSKKKTSRLPTLDPVPLPTLFTLQEVEEEQQLSTCIQDDIFLDKEAALQETVNSDLQGGDSVLLEWFSSAAQRRSSTGTVFNVHSEMDFPPLSTADTAVQKRSVFVPVTTDTHLSEPTASHDDDQEHEQWSQELVFVERSNRDAYKLREESTPAVVVDDESAWEEVSSEYSVLTLDTNIPEVRSSQGSCSGVVLPLASYRSALLKERDVALYSDEIVRGTSTDATDKTQPNNLSSVHTTKEGKHHGSDHSSSDDDDDLSAFDDRDGFKYGRGGKPALWFRGNVCQRRGSKSKFCGNKKSLNERRYRTPHRDREYYRMQKKE